MGRVLANELYHMLAQSKGHAKCGVARESLSARQLIAEKLDFSNHDCAFIQANGSKSFL